MARFDVSDAPDPTLSSWVDFHMLLRVNGVWEITNKTATHASRAAWAADRKLQLKEASITGPLSDGPAGEEVRSRQMAQIYRMFPVTLRQEVSPEDFARFLKEDWVEVFSITRGVQVPSTWIMDTAQANCRR